jgi:uncharacterized protein DUF3592
MERLPPGLKQSTPREVELTGTGRALFIVAMAVVAASIVIGVVMSRAFRDQAADRIAFAADSTTAEAEVTRLWQTSGDSHRRMVDYRFRTPAGSFAGRSRLSTAQWRSLRVGDRLSIRYRVSDPEESYAGNGGPNAPPLWLPWVIAAAIAAGGVGMLAVVRFERRLLELGRIAQGVVLTHHVHRSSHGGKHRSMTWEFPLLSGARMTGKGSTSSTPPAIGSALTIIYDPERPKRSRPYPLTLVRPPRG